MERKASLLLQTKQLASNRSTYIEIISQTPALRLERYVIDLQKIRIAIMNIDSLPKKSSYLSMLLHGGDSSWPQKVGRCTLRYLSDSARRTAICVVSAKPIESSQTAPDQGNVLETRAFSALFILYKSLR